MGNENFIEIIMSNSHINAGRQQLLILMDSMGGGGAERALLEVLKRLNPLHFEVDLILYRNKGVHLKAIPDYINVRSVYPKGEKSLVEKLITHTPLRERYEARKLQRLIGDKRYDTIISFMEGPAAMLHRYIMDYGKFNITWVHTDFSRFHWSRRFFRNEDQERQFYQDVNDIVFVSHNAMSHFSLDVTTPRHCIYNIIDSEAIARHANEIKIPKTDFVITFVGHLSPLKRPERLLQAIAILKQRGINVTGWLLGEGDLRTELEALTNELGIGDRIVFHGFQSNPYPYIAASDVLCLTSDAEGLPIVVQEAMTLGTPIVSTRCGGMTEAIGDGAGILVDSTPEAFADAVEKLFKDPALRVTITNAARRRMTMFDPENIMRQIENLITGGPAGA